MHQRKCLVSNDEIQKDKIQKENQANGMAEVEKIAA
jgi:hypothetical protein